MSLTTQIGGPERWSPDFGALPAESRVIEVQRNGVTVGRWVLMPIWHAEFLESDGTSSVGRQLWKGLRQTATDLGIRAVYTGAMDDTVRGLLTHVGATKLPGDHYIWEMPCRSE